MILMCKALSWVTASRTDAFQYHSLFSSDDNNNTKMCIALGTFSFVLESEECECQQRNAMNRTGCTGEAGQIRKAWQFLRLHHSTWKRL